MPPKPHVGAHLSVEDALRVIAGGDDVYKIDITGEEERQYLAKVSHAVSEGEFRDFKANRKAKREEAAEAAAKKQAFANAPKKRSSEGIAGRLNNLHGAVQGQKVRPSTEAIEKGEKEVVKGKIKAPEFTKTPTSAEKIDKGEALKTLARSKGRQRSFKLSEESEVNLKSK